MTILFSVTLTILFIELSVCFYFLIRNNKVLEFSYEIIELCHQYNLRRINEDVFEYESAYRWFLDKYSYDQLLYSFMPLKLENWYTKEEIDKLNS